MRRDEPCGVSDCPAVAEGADGFCAVHAGAQRAGHVIGGTRCTKCGRLVERGDWITRESTLDATTHASCPPPREYRGRKRDQWKPLIDGSVP